MVTAAHAGGRWATRAGPSVAGECPLQRLSASPRCYWASAKFSQQILCPATKAACRLPAARYPASSPNGTGETTALEIPERFRTRDAGPVEVPGGDPVNRAAGYAADVRLTTSRSSNARARMGMGTTGRTRRRGHQMHAQTSTHPASAATSAAKTTRPVGGGGYRMANSPFLTPAVKDSQADGANVSAGPPGSLESRTATP